MINTMMAMTVTCFLLFSLSTLLALDILAWVVGMLIIAGALVLLYYQIRQYRTLKSELAQLAKVKIHTVEYDLVLKTMRLAIFRVDLTDQTFTVETDYRDVNDSYVFPPGSQLEDIYKYMLPEYVQKMRQHMADLLEGLVDEIHEQFQMRKSDGISTYWTESFITVDKRDLQGRPLSIVGTLMRIDQQ